MANKWVLGSVAMMISFSAVAAPIDGWKQEVYDQNQTLLKAVIKLEMGKFFTAGVCSSTLIGKNILLTAKHCVDGLAPGKKITLNGNPQYEVVAIEQQPERESGKTSTDVALILFKSSDCSTATLGGIQPIELASEKRKSELSNRVLIAGYGKTTPQGSDSGVLRAGYNQWVVSDYSKTDPELSKVIQMAAAAIEIPEDSLIMKAERSDAMIFGNVKGQKISASVIGNMGMEIDPDTALPLPGDSGGPAIAFDSKQRPYIVGVTSMAAPKVFSMPASVIAVDPNTKETFFKASVASKSKDESEDQLMEQAMDDLMKKLNELKYVNASEVVLKDFGVVRLGGRAAFGVYASVLNPINDSFIQKAFSQLKKARDAANYCQ